MSDGSSSLLDEDILQDTCIDDILKRIDIYDFGKKVKGVCLYSRWNKEVFSAIQTQVDKHLELEDSQFITCKVSKDMRSDLQIQMERDMIFETKTISRIDKLLGLPKLSVRKGSERLEVSDWKLERFLSTPAGKVARIGQNSSIKTKFEFPSMDSAGQRIS